MTIGDNLIEKRIEQRIEKLELHEKKIYAELTKELKKLSKIRNPFMSKKVLLERILPLKIKGLIVMDKLNTLQSLKMPKDFSPAKGQKTLSNSVPRYVKEHMSLYRNVETAADCVQKEWKQIQEIISSGCIVWEMLSDISDRH